LDWRGWIKLNLKDLLILYAMFENNGHYDKEPSLKLKDVLARLKKI
jgi:hypothetical protein